MGSQDTISQASAFSVANCSLHYIAVLYYILLLCNFPKLLSLSGLALPTPGSPSCHIPRTPLAPVAGGRHRCSPALSLSPRKRFSASLQKQLLLMLHLLQRIWIINWPPGSSLIGNSSKSTFFSFLKSPNKVAKFDLKSSDPHCLI